MDDQRNTDRGAASILHLLFSTVVCVLLLSASGCNILGAAARVLPPPTIQPKYTGLMGQTVGVMVWVDRGLRMDFPSLTSDTAASFQNKLQHAADPHAKVKVLEHTTFPYRWDSVARYQHEHPEIESMSAADLAPRLGVSRLIYIEVEDFSTRAPASIDLYRGSLTATLRVIEISNGVGKQVYEENNIHAIFPPKVGEDGTPNGDDAKIYAGTIDALTTELVHRFVPYQEED